MALIIANIIGWARVHWRVLAYGVAALVLLIAVVVIYQSCGKREPKLNIQESERAKKAIAVEDRKEMLDVLVQSDAKEAEAEATEVNANAAKVNAIAESKKKWSEASNDEMAAELERRAKE
jgi:uncharacterized protein YpmS